MELCSRRLQIHRSYTITNIQYEPENTWWLSYCVCVRSKVKSNLLDEWCKRTVQHKLLIAFEMFVWSRTSCAADGGVRCHRIARLCISIWKETRHGLSTLYQCCNSVFARMPSSRARPRWRPATVAGLAAVEWGRAIHNETEIGASQLCLFDTDATFSSGFRQACGRTLWTDNGFMSRELQVTGWQRIFNVLCYWANMTTNIVLIANLRCVCWAKKAYQYIGFLGWA